MLDYGLARPIKYALQVMQLASQLHLHNDYMPFAITGLDVDTVEFVRVAFLIRLALKQFDDLYFLSDQYGDKTFKDIEIGLVAKHVLHRPIKPYIVVFLTHSCLRFNPRSMGSQYTGEDKTDDGIGPIFPHKYSQSHSK